MFTRTHKENSRQWEYTAFYSTEVTKCKMKVNYFAKSDTKHSFYDN